MKILPSILCLFLLSTSAFAYDEYVSGYRKQNGTYVNPYHRTQSNYTTSDNYSSYGNTNPYTGQKGYTRSYGSNDAGIGRFWRSETEENSKRVFGY